MADRRVTKTKNSIFKTFLNLVVDKPIENITVKEICEHANINKSTFYLHFKDIYDCRAECNVFLMNEIFDYGKLSDYETLVHNPDKYLSRAMTMFEQHKEFFLRFRVSQFYAPLIVVFKRQVVNALAEANRFTAKDHPNEYMTIVFLIAGLTDALFLALPSYDREDFLRLMSINITSGCIPYLKEKGTPPETT